LQQRQTDRSADTYHEFVARLPALRTVRLVVEFDCAQNREIAETAHNEVEVFGCDTIERTLARRRAT